MSYVVPIWVDSSGNTHIVIHLSNVRVVLDLRFVDGEDHWLKSFSCYSLVGWKNFRIPGGGKKMLCLDLLVIIFFT